MVEGVTTGTVAERSLQGIAVKEICVGSSGDESSRYCTITPEADVESDTVIETGNEVKLICRQQGVLKRTP